MHLTRRRAFVFAWLALAAAWLALAAAPLLGQQATVPPRPEPSLVPKGPHVLMGRVFDSGTDSPIGGAIVSLIGHFDSAGKPLPGIAPTMPTLPTGSSAMTSQDGYFVFRDLPAGQFSIAARALGYAVSDFPTQVVEIKDQQKPPLVSVWLWKFAAFGGRVIDEQGDPIVGVPVIALRRVWGSPTLRRMATELTDDRGAYRFAQLQPGEYFAAVMSTSTTLPAAVAAGLDPSPANREEFLEMSRLMGQAGLLRSYGCAGCISNGHEGLHYGGFVFQRGGVQLPPGPDGRPLGYANTYFPGTNRANDAEAIVVGSGETRANVDLRVQISSTHIVSGTLIGPTGPLDHVALNLAPHDTDLNGFEPPGVSSAVTDERGQFMFLGVAPGEYTLSALFAFDTDLIAGTGRPFWASRQVTVAGTDVKGVTVTMQPGVKISGRVEFYGPTGQVTRPTVRQVITLQPLRAESWNTYQAIIAADGTFRTPGDPPGRYLINASAPPGWFRHGTTLNGRPIPDEEIDLESVEVTGLVLRYGQTTNRITGTVTGANGAPDPTAAVIVFPADTNKWRDGSSQIASRRMRKVHATSTGAFDVSSLAPGEYHVVAVTSRWTPSWQMPSFLEKVVSAATKVSIGAEDTRTLTLRTVTVPRR